MVVIDVVMAYAAPHEAHLPRPVHRGNIYRELTGSDRGLLNSRYNRRRDQVSARAAVIVNQIRCRYLVYLYRLGGAARRPPGCSPLA